MQLLEMNEEWQDDISANERNLKAVMQSPSVVTATMGVRDVTT